MAYKINVMIAEDHELVRKGYISLLSENEDITVVGEVSNGKELIELIKVKEPDVVLLDLDMPIMDGKQTLEILNSRFSNIKTIIISMYYDDVFITEFLSRGARGFLPKNCNPETLIDAIYEVKENGYYFNKKISKALVIKLLKENFTNSIDKNALTEREIEVLKLICQEKANKEIADALNIAIRTVDFHRSNIYKKTQTQTSAGLALYAVKQGIISIV